MNRAEQNGKSLKNGKNFETDIKKSCEKYKNSKEAFIEKIPEPFAVYTRTKDGFFQGRFTASKAQPDFQGTLRGGKSYLMEAKFTSKDRISQNVLTEKQNNMLKENHELGAITYVIVTINDRIFNIPWETWNNMKELYGRKYIQAKDIPEYEIIPRRGHKVPFLDNLLKKGTSN